MFTAILNLAKFTILSSLLAFAGCAADTQKDIGHRVQFARGQSSKKIEGSVIRGSRDRYLVGARMGQMMSVKISSLENNAVFSLAKPDGKFVPGATDESDATHWSGKLPATGDFVIEVGGSRGNAKYVLTVAIK